MVQNIGVIANFQPKLLPFCGNVLLHSSLTDSHHVKDKRIVHTGCSQTSCKFLRLVSQSFFGLFQCFGLFYTINYGRFFILVLLGHEIEKKVDKCQTQKT